MKITEEQRKLLTEWLGECFRENCMGCPKEKEKYDCPSHYIDIRTFDNWTDFGAVVERIGWVYLHRFYSYIPSKTTDKEFPERFCILVAEAIKEGVIK